MEHFLKIKLLHPRAISPFKASENAIGLDVFACMPDRVNGFRLSPGCRVLIPLGFAAHIPPGCYGRIAPRSGLAFKNGLDVMAGVIDRDYRGEWKALLYNTDPNDQIVINHGDRVAQIIIEQALSCIVQEVEDLEATARGAGGFGSTGT